MKTKHPLCQPSFANTVRKVYRLGPHDARWRIDHKALSGSTPPGHAFIAMTGTDEATIYVADCDCADYSTCALGAALAWSATRIGCVSIERLKATKRS